MRRTALIVDDEPDLVAAICFAMEQAQWETRVAFDGRSALRLVRELDGPAVVLLDFRLPDATGCDVCRRIREVSAVPIVVVTAHGDEEYRRRSMEAGANAFLSKPVALKNLIEVAGDLLQRHESSMFR